MTPEQFSALAALMGQPDSKSAAAALRAAKLHPIRRVGHARMGAQLGQHVPAVCAPQFGASNRHLLAHTSFRAVEQLAQTDGPTARRLALR